MVTTISELADFDGVKLSVSSSKAVRNTALRLISNTVNLFESSEGLSPVDLSSGSQYSILKAVALATANTAIASLGAVCTSDGKPPESIYLTNGAQGKLVYRCNHNPYHEWSLDGSKRA